MPAVMIHNMRWEQKSDSDRPILGPSSTAQHQSPPSPRPEGAGRTAAAISSAREEKCGGDFGGVGDDSVGDGGMENGWRQGLAETHLFVGQATD